MKRTDAALLAQSWPEYELKRGTQPTSPRVFVVLALRVFDGEEIDARYVAVALLEEPSHLTAACGRARLDQAVVRAAGADEAPVEV